MGFTEILTIIFVLLKVFDVVSWSWWIVFLPEIIAVAFYVLLILFYVFSVAVATRHVNKCFKDVDF